MKWMDDIKISGLSKIFHSKKSNITALKNISLSINKGEIFGLLGPNGAGKTTLISILAGVTTPDNGTVTMLGKNVQTHYKEIQQEINIVRGFSGVLQNISTRELLKYYAKLYSVEEKGAIDAMRKTGIWEKRDCIVSDLSSGWRQRFFLAKALLNNPKILLLDEPTAGLDVHAARTMRLLLKQLNNEHCTLLLTTHNMQEAEELCDRIAVIHKGEIVAVGTSKQLKTSSKSTTLEGVFLNLTKEAEDERST